MSTTAERIRALLNSPMPCVECGAVLKIIMRTADEPWKATPGAVQIWPATADEPARFSMQCVCGIEWEDDRPYPTVREHLPWLVKTLEEIIA